MDSIDKSVKVVDKEKIRMDMEDMESKRIECVKKMGIHYKNLLSLHDEVMNKLDFMNEIANEFNVELNEKYGYVIGLEIPTLFNVEEAEDFMLINS